MHPPTSRRHRAAVVLRFFFAPHDMALEFVYWAEGVRRPSPQTPPGQGRVRRRWFAAAPVSLVAEPARES